MEEAAFFSDVSKILCPIAELSSLAGRRQRGVVILPVGLGLDENKKGEQKTDLY